MSEWMVAKVSDYWDEQTNAIDRFGSDPTSLDDQALVATQAEIADCVRRQFGALPEAPQVSSTGSVWYPSE